MQPDTHYATSGEVQIAYQVIGTGPLDLVLVPGYISNLDHAWEEPSLVNLISRMSSFSRVILFDKRGTGLSDRLGNLPTLEERMDDVRAVMDAVGSESAALLGVSEGGAMSMLFGDISGSHPSPGALRELWPFPALGASPGKVRRFHRAYSEGLGHRGQPCHLCPEQGFG
jgi:alpha-beta hydrolase superfamily lysophospholipase